MADDEEYNNQKEFFFMLRELLNRRGNPNENKQANIFTTNYDMAIELSMEKLQLDYNDGFKGRINPYYSTANYGNLFYKQTLISNSKTEIPMVNLFKMHGSVSWKVDNGIVFSFDYKEKIKDMYLKYQYEMSKYDYKYVYNLIEEKKDDELKKINGKSNFVDELHKTLCIVLPTKEKFNETIFNLYYHEMLRIFSNELEKEQSVLITFGFSFADEHILELVKRSLSNSSLKVFVFCYTYDEVNKIRERLFGAREDEKYNLNVSFVWGKDKFDIIKFNEFIRKILGE